MSHTLIGPISKRACADSTRPQSDLSLSAVYFLRSSNLIVFLLSDIQRGTDSCPVESCTGCNLVDANLAEVITDYFTFEESEASSDNDSAGKPFCLLCLRLSVDTFICSQNGSGIVLRACFALHTDKQS